MLSAIRRKFESLSFKLPLLYVISTFVFLLIFAIVINFVGTNQAYSSIQRMMEIGPGYPSELKETDTISQILPKDLTARQLLDDFTEITSNNVQGSVDETGTLISYSMQAELGGNPITINRVDFPLTFSQAGFNTISNRKFFYQKMSGSNVFIVASVDREAIVSLEDAQQTLRWTFYIFPGILILASLFGVFVIRRAVAPLKEITDAAEGINDRDLGRRVSYGSKDEVGRLVKSFNHMADRLEGAFQREKRFISDAAHELRTPLASIKTMVTFALSNFRKREDAERLLVEISSRLEAMEMLVNDLLIQSKADESSGLPDQTVNLVDIINDVAEAFDPLFEERGIQFALATQRHLMENGLNVAGERKLYLRLFSNLLDNAVKNTPPGGSVRINVAVNESSAVIEVKDTGRGIAPEHLDRIFERFYKISGDDEAKPGFGLGLSICRSIVRGYGGDISATSILWKGTSFTVSLPLSSVDDSTKYPPKL